MSNIFWNSSSINSFFNTSLNTSNSMSSLYSAFNDSAMIKSGSYKKLMKSYFDTVGESDSSKSSSSSSSKSASSSSKASRHACTYTYDSQKKTVSTIKNKVLEDLLSDEPKKSSITNPVLDELLKKDDKTDGTVTDKTENTSDAAVSEAAAGSVIDEAI